MDVDAAGGSRAGLTPEQIAAVEHWDDSNLFLPKQQIVLALAEGMTATPVQVSDDIFTRAREQFTEAELVELTTEIAFENFRARFNRTFGIESQGLCQRMLEKG